MWEQSDVLSRTPPKADARIHYAAGESQFGDLWVPDGAKKPLPVIVFLHGGWWQAEYGLEYAGHLCAAFKKAGVAVWSLEYRRVGEAGGGWPNTFLDVAAGANYLGTLSKKYPLEVNSVVTMGHSAGGHLALWLAGRHHVDHSSAIYAPTQLPLRGVVSLAGAVDLRLVCDLAQGKFAHDKDEVRSLMGGLPAEFPDRYRAGSPGDLLPLNVQQVLIQGTEDGQIPPDLPRRYAENARRQGDEVVVKMIPGAGHFEVVDPQSVVFDVVRAAGLALLKS